MPQARQRTEDVIVEQRIWYRAIPKPRRSTSIERGLSLEQRRYASSLKGMGPVAANDIVVGT
jgi:hypothetical protein